MSGQSRAGVLAVAGGAVIVTLLPQLLNGYQVFVLCQMGIAAIGALGMTLLIGHGGLVSLGHAAMMAVGAFTAAALTTHVDLAFPVAVLAGVAGAAIVGLALGFPLLRLSGPYLAVATLGLAVALPETIVNWGAVVDAVGFGDPQLFGGHLGLQPPRPQLGPLSVSSPYRYWYVIAVALTIAIVVMRRTIDSTFGRALRAYRESPVAATAFGIHTQRVRIQAFAVAAGFAGLAGALQAHLLFVVSPATFGMDTALFMLMAVVVGGATSVAGTVVAVALLSVLQEFVTGTAWNVQLVYGVTVAATVLFTRNGLAGIGSAMLERWRRRRPDVSPPVVGELPTEGRTA